MASRKLKVIMVLGGLLFGFLILELGMRLTGYLMISAREVPLGQEKRESFLLTKKNSEKIRIMAIGDSTTNGGTLPLQDTYPFMLYDLIQKSEFKDIVTVANHGRCEYNSSMTLNQVKHQLDDYKPQIVLLLTGEADRFNPIGLEEELQKVSPTVVLESFLLKFRVYKLIRGIAINLNYKYLVKNSSMYSNDDYIQNQKNIDLIIKAFELAKENKGEEARTHLSQVVPAIPKHLLPDLKGDLTVEFGPILEYPQVSQLSYMIGKQEYSEVVALSIKYLKEHPYALFDENRDGVIYSLFWAMDFQSEYKAPDILKEIKKLSEIYPEVESSEPYLDFVRRLKNYNQIMKIVDARREKNIVEMLKIFKEKNIQVFVLNYPAEFSQANKTLETQAKMNSLPFIDIRSAFVEFIERDGREAWLLDDEHPTVQGNKELSKIVFEQLRPALKKLSLKTNGKK